MVIVSFGIFEAQLIMAVRLHFEASAARARQEPLRPVQNPMML
jgi:hypothetical protein